MGGREFNRQRAVLIALSALSVGGAVAIDSLSPFVQQDKIHLARVGLSILAVLFLGCAALNSKIDKAIAGLTRKLGNRNGFKIVPMAPLQSVARGLAVFWCAGAGGLALYFLTAGPNGLWLVREDGVLEWLTAALYLIAAFLILSASLRLNFRGLLKGNSLLLALLFFVVGMEEISWGQRIFAIETPGLLKDINIQGEMTLHNIWSISLTTYPALAVVASLLFFIPLLVRNSAKYGRLLQALQFPVAPFAQIWLFVWAMVIYLVIGFKLGTPTPLPISFHGVMPSADDEILEFLFSGQFFILSLSFWQIRQEPVERMRALKGQDRSPGLT